MDNLISQKISIKCKDRVCYANLNTFLLFPKTLLEVPLYLPQEPPETDTKWMWTKEIQDFYTEKKIIKDNSQRAITLIYFCDKDSNEEQA